MLVGNALRFDSMKIILETFAAGKNRNFSDLYSVPYEIISIFKKADEFDFFILDLITPELQKKKDIPLANSNDRINCSK